MEQDYENNSKRSKKKKIGKLLKEFEIYSK